MTTLYNLKGISIKRFTISRSKKLLTTLLDDIARTKEATLHMKAKALHKDRSLQDCSSNSASFRQQLALASNRCQKQTLFSTSLLKCWEFANLIASLTPVPQKTLPKDIDNVKCNHCSTLPVAFSDFSGFPVLEVFLASGVWNPKLKPQSPVNLQL